MALVITLFVLGTILLFAEVFAPGLILGTLGVVMIVGSMGYGWYLYPEYGIFIVIGETALSSGIVIFGLYLMATGRGPINVSLDTSQNSDEGWRSYDVNPDLLGATGVAHTALRPAGTIVVNDERLDAVSSGNYIDRGTPILIVEIEGHRVVVEPLEQVEGKLA